METSDELLAKIIDALRRCATIYAQSSCEPLFHFRAGMHWRLFVVPMRLGRFFRDIGRPVTMASQSAPGPADFQRLLEIAHTYGFCRWPPD
jgi:hypothetical protein